MHVTVLYQLRTRYETPMERGCNGSRDGDALQGETETEWSLAKPN